eukprot:3210777-Rhodomonas_salina.2
MRLGFGCGRYGSSGNLYAEDRSCYDCYGNAVEWHACSGLGHLWRDCPDWQVFQQTLAKQEQGQGQQQPASYQALKQLSKNSVSGTTFKAKLASSTLIIRLRLTGTNGMIRRGTQDQ